MGTIRLGKRTDDRTPADQGLRAARRARRHRVRARGTRSPTTPTSPPRAPACSTAASTSSRSPTRCATSARCRPRSTATTSSGSTATNVMARRRQAGDARGDPRGHQPLPRRQAGRPPRHDLVRLDRDLHRARPGAHRPRGVRGGDRRQRPDDRPVDALRLRRAAGGRAVRQRRAEPHGRHRRRCASSPPSATSRSAARTSRPARR